MRTGHTVQDINNMCEAFLECSEYLKLISSWARIAGDRAILSDWPVMQGEKVVLAWVGRSTSERVAVSNESIELVYRMLVTNSIGLLTNIIACQAMYARARHGDKQFCLDLLRPCMHRLNEMSPHPMNLEKSCETSFDYLTEDDSRSGGSVCYEFDID